MTIRIVHVTSVHPRFDTRIFHKECRSAVSAGYEVTLVVADGLGNSFLEGVRIIDVGRPSGRLSRMLRSAYLCIKQALALQPALLHLHDPELLPYGAVAALRKYTVIFDAHEDVAKQILGKPYLAVALRQAVSIAYRLCEGIVLRPLSAVIAATPTIRNMLSRYNARVVDINNYPILGELVSSGLQFSPKVSYVCYVGGLSRIRGIIELINALELAKSDVRLLLAGKFLDPEAERAARSLPGWSRVDFLGLLDRNGVRDVLSRSVAGLVTLHPRENYLEALPVKMFEYMSAGLPVIASNFPLWREIVNQSGCGLCVDPLAPAEIAAAIDTLLGDLESARQLGRSGLHAVETRYNWSIEERKLIALYDSLCRIKSMKPEARDA